jgi:hypothetical protein
MFMNRSRLLRPVLTVLVAANLALLAAGASAQTAEEELVKKVDQLVEELAKVKAQLKELQDQRAAAAAAPAPQAPAGQAQAGAVPAAQVPVAAESAASRPTEPATVFFSYGEINYNRPINQSEDTQFDLRRFVLGFQHRFDDKNKVVTELEVEHAVSSASDPGEVEVEQAFVDHTLNGTWSAQGGLFLIPAGLLNEKHEPTAYYGVERNFVETAIIPTTWREGGIQIIGNFENGLTLQGGLTSGFDLNKWDATSTEGQDSPLGSIHQELALAKAHDLSVFGALNWRGVPGLQLGGSIFTGGASQGQAGDADARVTLWDLHARWTPGRWDLAALYARGYISNTAEFNVKLVGNPTLIPQSFDGWYTQAAYKLWTHQDYVLTPFARWEQYNTGRSFADIGQGLTPAPYKTERVLTLGANFQVYPGIVLKADYQRFHVNEDNNRFDLGLGWSF